MILSKTNKKYYANLAINFIIIQISWLNNISVKLLSYLCSFLLDLVSSFSFVWSAPMSKGCAFQGYFAFNYFICIHVLFGPNIISNQKYRGTRSSKVASAQRVFSMIKLLVWIKYMLAEKTTLIVLLVECCEFLGKIRYSSSWRRYWSLLSFTGVWEWENPYNFGTNAMVGLTFLILVKTFLPRRLGLIFCSMTLSIYC